MAFNLVKLAISVEMLMTDRIGGDISGAHVLMLDE